MPGYVSREQIAQAKEVNIEDYIRSHEPNNIKRIGNAIYLKDHDSLRISNGLWKWESAGIGGKNVIDYLIKVRGFEFVDAVQHLVGHEITSVRNIEPKARPPNELLPAAEREPLKLPRRHVNNNRVIAYLQERWINEKLIQDCIRQNILYESVDFHNAVFVGRDEHGKARFAALRGTLGNFKRDADGSDKRYGFCLPSDMPKSDSVAVFESPIDALSHKMMEPEYTGYRLSLGGTASTALTQFLNTHEEINNITVCTDNDTAGNSAARKIAELTDYRIMRELPPDGAKDWNDALISNRNEVNILEDKRKSVRFIKSDYTMLFTVKDGDSIKFTSGFDGEVKNLKCRVIDEAHIQLIGKYTNEYHICEFAEKMEAAGNKYEEIPGQKPKLNILAAKYGESLQSVEIPMTEAAIKKLVGGKYEIEDVRGEHALLRGKDGVAVCKVDDGVFTTVHPYWAQTLKRELGVIDPPKKPSIIAELEDAKAEAAVHNAASKSAERPKNRAEQEV